MVAVIMIGCAERECPLKGFVEEAGSFVDDVWEQNWRCKVERDDREDEAAIAEYCF